MEIIKQLNLQKCRMNGHKAQLVIKITNDKTKLNLQDSK